MNQGMEEKKEEHFGMQTSIKEEEVGDFERL